MAKPAIVAVDDDAEVLRAVARDLREHFGREYRILPAASGAEAARQLLNFDGTAPPEPEPVDPRSAAFRLAAAMLAFLLLFGALAGLIWVLT